MLTEETTGPRTKPVMRVGLLGLRPFLAPARGRPPFHAGPVSELAEMFEGREDLADRVRDFWNDSTAEESCFTEMQVLAQHAEAVESSPIRTRCGPPSRRRSPRSRSTWRWPRRAPEDRRTYLDRLRRLRESPALLRSYLELLEAVWAPVDDMWQQALPVIEEAGRHVVAQYERGRSLELLIPQGCDILRERLPEILAKVEVGQQPLLFVPCLFFGSSMYMEVSGLITIGTGVGQGDVVARAQTESVARRLKAVADPTRLALLHSLASAPSSVGELAVLFRLAQPTVSMHVKVLRENGLVRSQREGGRLRLSADAAAVELLLDELRQAVLHGTEVPQPAGASTTGSDRIPATVVDRTLSAGPVTS